MNTIAFLLALAAADTTTITNADIVVILAVILFAAVAVIRAVQHQAVSALTAAGFALFALSFVIR